MKRIIVLLAVDTEEVDDDMMMRGDSFNLLLGSFLRDQMITHRFL